MTILDDLRQDHRVASDLLRKTIAATDAAARGDHFKQFRTEFLAHAHAEQRVLYRALERDEDTRADALEGNVEHEVTERLVEELTRGRAKGNDQWTARATVLSELIRHHIEEEESQMFPAARGALGEDTLARLSADFQAEKEKEKGTLAPGGGRASAAKSAAPRAAAQRNRSTAASKPASGRGKTSSAKTAGSARPARGGSSGTMKSKRS